jgi:hypothetical protein
MVVLLFWTSISADLECPSVGFRCPILFILIKIVDSDFLVYLWMTSIELCNYLLSIVVDLYGGLFSFIDGWSNPIFLAKILEKKFFENHYQKVMFDSEHGTEVSKHQNLILILIIVIFEGIWDGFFFAAQKNLMFLFWSFFLVKRWLKMMEVEGN